MGFNLLTYLRSMGIAPHPDYFVVLKPDAVVAKGGTATTDKGDESMEAGWIVEATGTAYDPAFATATAIHALFMSLLEVRILIDQKPLSTSSTQGNPNNEYLPIAALVGVEGAAPRPLLRRIAKGSKISHSWVNRGTSAGSAPSLDGRVILGVVTDAKLAEWRASLGRRDGELAHVGAALCGPRD